MALTKVTYTDLVTIIGAQNLNDIQDAIIALEEWQSEAGADIPQILADIAPSFSNSTSYSAGDCVIVLNKLYQFTAAHPAGNWTGTDATEVNVTSLLKEAVASLSGEVADLKSAFSGSAEGTTSITLGNGYISNTGVLTSDTGGYYKYSQAIDVRRVSKIRIQNYYTGPNVATATILDNLGSVTAFMLNPGAGKDHVDLDVPDDGFAAYIQGTSALTPTVTLIKSLKKIETEITSDVTNINALLESGVYYTEKLGSVQFVDGYYDNNGTPHAQSYNSYYISEALDCYDTDYLILTDYAKGGSFETVTFFSSPFCDNNKRISGVVNPASGVIKVPDGALGFRVNANINLPYRSTKISKVRKAFDFKRNYLFVSRTAGQNISGAPMDTFASIYDANASITDNSKSNRYYIIVDSLEYTDLQTKYSGDTSTSGLQGVICKDYVYYMAYNQVQSADKNAICTITWDGATGLNSSDVTIATTGLKCFFHIQNNVHTAIKGFKLYGKNLRYGMHIETTGTAGAADWLIENCEIVYYGNPDTVDWPSGWTKPVIGVGTTLGEHGVIRNCKLTNADEGNADNGMIMQTHDNANNPATGLLKVGTDYLVENCVLTAKGTSSATFVMRSGDATYDIPNTLKINRCVDTSSRKTVYVTQSTGDKWTFVFEATNGGNA